MIITCSETKEHKIERLGNWHKKFVWFPHSVYVQDGKHQCAWLETIERRRFETVRGGIHCNHFMWVWEYRLPNT